MNKPPHILIVDDEQVIRHNCMKILAAEGYTADAAETGSECLKLIGQGAYDVILLDMKIPDIDGEELLIRIKEVSPGSHIIVITGYPTVDSVIDTRRLGATDYLMKPFTPDELLGSVRAAAAYSGNSAFGLQYEYRLSVPPVHRRDPGGSWAASPQDPVYFSETMGVRTGKDMTARVILHPLFTSLYGRIGGIDLPEKGDDVSAERPACTVYYRKDNEQTSRSVKLGSPLSGRVIDVNTSAKYEMDRIADDPFRSGWLFRVYPANLAEDIRTLRPFRLAILCGGPDAQSLACYFREIGYSVCLPDSFDDLCDGAAQRQIDAVVLDSGRVGRSRIAKKLSILQQNGPVPVIFLGEKLDSGIQDLMTRELIYFFSPKPVKRIQAGLAVKNAFLKQEFARIAPDSKPTLLHI